ncbi:MAG: ScyD/ScyE family protein [Chloroflexi bacterium]|nr:ScyD/ScyE family protein [Chloroflexota bacterium]
MSLDAFLAAVLVIAALGLRLPYLWTIPRFTDETREVLRAFAILHGETPGLVNVDDYIGGLYNWLLAAIFWLTGPSAETPRLVVAIASALTVGATYLLARDLGGRAAALVTAGLLVTAGGQILSNGHIAWSHCLTPLFTTLAAWLLQRAVRRDSRAALLGSGFTFGLALQTHPATLVLLPGAAVYLLGWGRRWLRTPWPYLALALFVLAISNVLACNAIGACNSVGEASVVQERYAQGKSIVVDLQTYVENHLPHGVMLLSYLAGAVDQRGPVDARGMPKSFLPYLLDPTLWLYGGLSVAGLVFAARRGAPLALLLTLSSVSIMPYFNERKYVPISDGRYLMPLLPLAYAGIGMLAAALWRTIGVRGAGLRAAWTLAIVLLISWPLVPLTRYYGQEIAAGRTNAPLWDVVGRATEARRPEEPVLLDRDLSEVKLEGGGTAFRSLRFLLAGAGLDSPSVDNLAGYGRTMAIGTSALLLTDARGFAGHGGEFSDLRALGVVGTPLSAPPSPDGFGIYRLERIGTRADGSLDESRLNTVADGTSDDVGEPLAWSATIGPRGISLYQSKGKETDNDGDMATPTANVPVEIFATGLVNPRGLAFRSDGSLFVAEAGTGNPGGAEAAAANPATTEVSVGREKPHRYGRTGQITRIMPDGDMAIMAKNLPSIVTAVNEECGPSALVFVDDTLYVLMASGGWEIGDPAFHSGIYKLTSDGRLERLWDMTAYILEHPGKARIDDPRADVPGGMAYGMTYLNGKFYVTDANQDQVLEYDPATGGVRQVIEYPKSNRALTGITVGPDQNLYVAEMASNKITRISADGEHADAATKLLMPIDVAFGPDGRMYALEFTGRLHRPAPENQPHRDTLVEGLRAPTAMTFGPDGNLYVSVWGQNSPKGEGQILRLRLNPDSPEVVQRRELSRWVLVGSWIAGILVFGLFAYVGLRFRAREHRG